MMDVARDSESLIMRRDELVYWVLNQALICLVDASWDFNSKSRLLGMNYDLRGIIQYGCFQYTELEETFQAEVQAGTHKRFRITSRIGNTGLTFDHI
jgi:hypothetical protein